MRQIAGPAEPAQMGQIVDGLAAVVWHTLYEDDI